MASALTPDDLVASGSDLVVGDLVVGDDLTPPPGSDLLCPGPVGVNVPPDKMPDMWSTLCLYTSPCPDYCPNGWNECCSPAASDGGAFLVHCVPACAHLGRRPEGLHLAEHVAGCPVGQYFARMAHLEAASVPAFRRLEQELREHGAPAELIVDARRSLREEVGHARAARRMALAHHVEPPKVKVTRPRRRGLEEMAIENAKEGCVGETYSALVAEWQARAAGDANVRAMMTNIALEETRHAELAWAVDAWLKSKLDRAARRRVKEARDQAVAELGSEIAAAVPALLVERLGVPDAERAQKFFDAAKRTLWS
jgi:hypothetical protein